MAKYFYYNDKGEKKGAFSGKEIKALAKAGIINPQTIIETEEGKQYYAHGIGELEFASEDTEQHEPNSDTADIENVSVQQKAMLVQKDLEIADLRLRNWQMESKILTSNQQKERQDSSIIPQNYSKTFSFKPPSIPKWIDGIDEKKYPGGFCDSIKNCLYLAHFIFSLNVLAGLGLIVFGICLALDDDMGVGMWLVAQSVIALACVFLVWGIVVIFLKSIRTTICHQLVVEQHVAKQTEYLQMLAEIQMPANGVYVLEE